MLKNVRKRSFGFTIFNAFPFKQRLTELRLLPLSYYFKLHDLLVLVSMLKGSYNIKLTTKLNKKPNDDLLLTKQNDLTSISKTRTRKADKNV